jgi:uncharacterized membrane protein
MVSECSHRQEVGESDAPQLDATRRGSFFVVEVLSSSCVRQLSSLPVFPILARRHHEEADSPGGGGGGGSQFTPSSPNRSVGGSGQSKGTCMALTVVMYLYLLYEEREMVH